MAQDNTAATLSANFKEIYGDEVNKIIPASAVLMKEIPFSTAYKLGDKYIQPVMLSHENGVTYLGTNPTTLTLNAAIAAEYKEAQVDGSSIILRSSISYSAADKMMSSKQAFMIWSQMLVENMTDSITKRNEIDMLYGQSGIGTVSTISGSPTFGLSTASWADAIWAGMEGCTLDVFTSNFATQRNTVGALTISAVSFDNRTLTLTGNAGDLSAIQIGDVFVFRGAVTAGSPPTHFAMAGLHKILTNTGTLFNISASTYNLWKGVEYSVGSAALTLGKIFVGVSRSIARGLAVDTTVLVNPKTFANLNSDQASLRRYGAEKKGTNGFETLEFYSGNGKIQVRSHLYVKEGDAFAVPMEYCKRIGSTDVTFRLPNADPDSVFLHVPDKAAYELRVRSEQCIFLEKPAQGVYFKDIVNAV